MSKSIFTIGIVVLVAVFAAAGALVISLQHEMSGECPLIGMKADACAAAGTTVKLVSHHMAGMVSALQATLGSFGIALLMAVILIVAFFAAFLFPRIIRYSFSGSLREHLFTVPSFYVDLFADFYFWQALHNKRDGIFLYRRV